MAINVLLRIVSLQPRLPLRYLCTNLKTTVYLLYIKYHGIYCINLPYTRLLVLFILLILELHCPLLKTTRNQKVLF